MAICGLSFFLGFVPQYLKLSEKKAKNN